ncbi:MAG: polyphosphate kinase 1 [Spirochaetes bacterium]|nr:polyphosphate kinase 1 [Spirochaetota bacterium]MBU0955715.1 polyphosphate kinase 1 [Spirochaetota bacterium]
MPAEKAAVPYFNRELSWLEFNARVLEEALDAQTPLLERLKFMSIVSANFDEFFMVRMGALREQLRQDEQVPDLSGLSPAEIYRRVAERAHELTSLQYKAFSSEIMPALAREGLHVLRPAVWKPAVLHFLDNFFRTRIMPVLTPLAVSNEDDDEFPTTGNLRIHAAFLLLPAEAELDTGAKLRDDFLYPGERLALVQVPPNMARFIPVPGLDDGQVHMALLDDVILTFGHLLFSGWRVQERCLFKIARDADIGVDELRDDDFVAAMQEVLATRHNSIPIRMTTSGESERLVAILAGAMELDERDVYCMDGPIDLRSFMELVSMKGFDHLRYPPREALKVFSPGEDSSLWSELQRRDLLVHLPYESFSVVTEFFETAAKDPSVLAIKATLYRTSGDSPVVRALTRAARSGKQVTVIVELKARFDEERNIAWATRLEQAGAIVVYGAAHLKVHAKAALVVRREEDDQIRRYAHVSTGNYNEKTARLYGDIGLLTANSAICTDIGAFFNVVSGLSQSGDLKTLVMAPFELKSSLIAMIDREAERSSLDAPGMIAAKLNALCDPEVIAALYRASQAGVRILLNVRGVCQLVPGRPGLSESIRVVSIIGRYLEHARIYYFRNGGSDDLYLASADWMPRNLLRRVELMVPLLSPEIRDRVYETLMASFMDNVKARELDKQGHWQRIAAAEGLERFSSQDNFYAQAEKRLDLQRQQTLATELQVRRNKL